MRRTLALLTSVSVLLAAAAAGAAVDGFKCGVFDPPRMAPEFDLQASNDSSLALSKLRGKVAAEKEAFAIGAREVLPVIAINPGFILGPRFFKLSESVRQVADFVNRGMPFYFDGGFPVVDVEDVAQGAILALERGRAGERYIVGGENITVKQLYELIAELTGMRAPAVRAPVPVVRALATVLELAGTITGTRPLMDRNMVDEFAGRYGFQHSTRAARELGYTWRPAREVVRRTVAWLVDRGFVSERRRRALTLHPSLHGAY